MLSKCCNLSEGPLIIPDPATVTPVRLLLANLAGRVLPEMEVAKIRSNFMIVIKRLGNETYRGDENLD